MLAGAGAELFDLVMRMDGLKSFAEEFPHCLEIPLGRHKLKVLSLERILASKIAANRPKDKLSIPVLRDALIATQMPKPTAKNQPASKSVPAEPELPFRTMPLSIRHRERLASDNLIASRTRTRLLASRRGCVE